MGDPNEVELLDGDVIVARGTDSAWTPLFFEAAAVVIDIGSEVAEVGTLVRGFPRELPPPAAIAA